MERRLVWPCGAILALLLASDARVFSADTSDCRVCHEKAVSALEATRHHGVEKGCEACHGDVSAHLKAETESGETGAIAYLRKLKAAETSKTCLECHDKGHPASFPGGVHERRGVGCLSCHSVHGFKSARAQLKSGREGETCYACHAGIRARAMRVSHHPVREGIMECSSCHDAHESKPKMVSAESLNDKCYSCHAEKRGPFVWEHPPSRENCMLCHDPHGSNHRNLLVAKVPFLCQRCHLNSLHAAILFDGREAVRGGTPSSFSVGRACNNCHRAVHGTNAPSGAILAR
jgi:DmsE family decaheme c-type cytochrome